MTATSRADLLETARALALDYSRSLPNFICTEKVERSHLVKNQWVRLDRLAFQLDFVSQHENYTLPAVTTPPPAVTDDRRMGASSTGEFGSYLNLIFGPKSKAVFTLEEHGRLRGHDVAI